MATITSRNGQQFVVPDEVEGDYLEQGFTRPGERVVDYGSMKARDLAALIAARNEGRDAADRIPSGKKADMVAALEADDASAVEAATSDVEG